MKNSLFTSILNNVEQTTIVLDWDLGKGSATYRDFIFDIEIKGLDYSIEADVIINNTTSIFIDIINLYDDESNNLDSDLTSEQRGQLIKRLAYCINVQ